MCLSCKLTEIYPHGIEKPAVINNGFFSHMTFKTSVWFVSKSVFWSQEPPYLEIFSLQRVTIVIQHVTVFGEFFLLKHQLNDCFSHYFNYIRQHLTIKPLFYEKESNFFFGSFINRRTNRFHNCFSFNIKQSTEVLQGVFDKFLWNRVLQVYNIGKY